MYDVRAGLLKGGPTLFSFNFFQGLSFLYVAIILLFAKLCCTFKKDILICLKMNDILIYL